ncbi:MAG: amidohydrolase family protein, partial [Candidatus Ventricola sp.]|nr:amidohydrolase family protein [Candidatus Ventricola sp.]
GQGHPVYSQPIEDEAFVRLVRRHGVEHVLFGTDSPWADQHAYVRKIQSLPLTDAEKTRILWQNAAGLLHIV